MNKFKAPYLGAAYYPEAWPLEQVDSDIALMKQARINIVRIGEFAWSRIEPRQGEYDLEWLIQVIDKLGNAGIATIIGTPTATPPIWLIRKHPDILIVRDDGKPAQHGAREHFCPNNFFYREYCKIVITKLAEQFGADRNVIGWQIDNELYPRKRGCCCPECHRKFQAVMQKRFRDIDQLNKAWCTNLWSQTYQLFSQLPIPREDTWHHPSLLTAWMNFQSDSYIDFAKHQADILHKLCCQPIGTDMMTLGGLNYHKIHKHLDIVQFNWYYDESNLWRSVFWMDLLRPIKNRPFWITETSTCWNGSTASNKYRSPGFCRVASWIPIALGGEANLFWLWRSHWAGQELMHGSVISSCGRWLHIIDEVKEVASGFREANNFINETKCVNSGLAVHFSSLAWWIFEFQPMVNGFKYDDKLLESFYRPLIEASLRADIIDPADSLDNYRVVCSPFLPALDEAGLRSRIIKWVEEGGTWIVGPLSDNRTLEATKFTHAPFGSLEEWTGVRCKYQVPGDSQDFQIQCSDQSESKGSIWFDGFEMDSADALATYSEGHLKGLAAIIKKKVGRGQIVLLGTMPSPEHLQKLLLSLCKEAGIVPSIKTTPNVLVVSRKGRDGEGVIAIEFQNRPGSIDITQPVLDLLTGDQLGAKVEMEPYSVKVLKYITPKIKIMERPSKISKVTSKISRVTKDFAPKN